MRSWLSLFFLAPVLLAQSDQTAPLVAAPPTPYVKRPAKVCSIPLVNVLAARRNARSDRMAIPIGPQVKEHFPTVQVTPPAPPCDDKKR